MRRIRQLSSKSCQSFTHPSACRLPSPNTLQHRPRFRLRQASLLLGLLSLLVGVSGCEKPTASTPSSEAAPVRATPTKLIAQGQILPWGGLVRLNGTPGDTVNSILVSVGDTVTAGQTLIEFSSATLRQSQLDSLKQQLKDAELQKAAAIERARLELSAARMQLNQASDQVQAASRRAESLALLGQQAEEARAALKRIESLAADPLTRSMISQLDIDKQRANVTASQLQVIQQRELGLQSESAAQWGEKLAKERVTGAESALRLAEQADPLSLIRMQITAAEQQLERARLISPIAGNVVAIDTRVGESVAQFPLIQVADLSRMGCVVEIYQTDAPHVRIGQQVQLRNIAFEQPLKGSIARIDRLVGYPQLRSMDPLAKVDYRTLPVMVEITPADSATAARWLQLQVEVEVALSDSAGLPNERVTAPQVSAAANSEGQTSVSPAALEPVSATATTQPDRGA